MASYFEVNCKGIAHIVDKSESNAEIVDIDLARSKSLLKERLEQQPSKPIIVLSTQKVSIDNVIYVKKPIEVPHIIDALKTAKNDHLSGQDTPPNNLRSNTSAKPLTKKQKKRSKNKQKLKATIGATPINISSAIAKPEKLLNDSSSLKTKKPIEAKKTLEPKTSRSFSISIAEIDRLLKELNHPFKKLQLSEIQKSTPDQKNARKTIRYAFEPIEGNIEKRSLIGANKSLSVLIINLSSRGALIELKKPLPLRGKVTLTIQSESQKTFEIPARIARKEDNATYGLQFLNSQHELIDFLINTGQSFLFS